MEGRGDTSLIDGWIGRLHLSSSGNWTSNFCPYFPFSEAQHCQEVWVGQTQKESRGEADQLSLFSHQSGEGVTVSVGFGL